MFISLLAAAALLSTPLHDFQFVGASNASALFVEDTSMSAKAGLTTVWVVAINDPNSDMAKQYPGAYSMMSHDLDCKARTDAVTHLYVYSDNGDILAERQEVYRTAALAPMSAGELIFDYACTGSISTDKVVKFHTLNDVKNFGRSWLELYDKAEALGLMKK